MPTTRCADVYERRLLTAVLVGLVVVLGARAAEAQTPPAPEGDVAAPLAKHAMATRVSADAITVDGRLNEEVWLRAPAVTDFVQKEPTQGAAPTDAMEVHFAYDDRAFYVGARMASTNARGIQAPIVTLRPVVRFGIDSAIVVPGAFTAAGFPCCVSSPCIHAVANTPAEPPGLLLSLPQRHRPSLTER